MQTHGVCTLCECVQAAKAAWFASLRWLTTVSNSVGRLALSSILHWLLWLPRRLLRNSHQKLVLHTPPKRWTPAVHTPHPGGPLTLHVWVTLPESTLHSSAAILVAMATHAPLFSHHASLHTNVLVRCLLFYLLPTRNNCAQQLRATTAHIGW